MINWNIKREFAINDSRSYKLFTKKKILIRKFAFKKDIWIRLKLLDVYEDVAFLTYFLFGRRERPS